MRRGRSFYDWSEDVIKEAVSHCQNYAETLRYLDYPYNNKETLLKDFIELKNFTQQANKYGITTVILQRWYRDYELPSKVKELKEYIKNYEYN